MPSAPKRKLGAIMFTDMVGYAALMQEDEGKARELIEQHRNQMKPIVDKHGTKELKLDASQGRKVMVPLLKTKFIYLLILLCTSMFLSCSRYNYVSPGIKVGYGKGEGPTIGADLSVGKYRNSLLAGVALGFEYTFANRNNVGNNYMQAYIGVQVGIFILNSEFDLLIVQRNGEYQFGSRSTLSLYIEHYELHPPCATSSERIRSYAYAPFVSGSRILKSNEFTTFGFLLKNVYAYDFDSKGSVGGGC